MKKCERCNNLHDGKYGSGRFCSINCANKRVRTQEVKDKISKSVRAAYNYVTIERNCKYCDKDMTFTVRKDSKLIESKKYCSRDCSRRSSIKKATLKNTNNKEVHKKISQTRKNKFASGELKVTGGNTKWYRYKDIRVQGTYELRVCKLLDKMKELKLIQDWEYTNDRVPYIGTDNEHHMYLLDFKVTNNDNSFYYIETKGYKKENDDNKWNAIKEKGYELIVMFDEDIRLLEEKYL